MNLIVDHHRSDLFLTQKQIGVKGRWSFKSISGFMANKSRCRMKYMKYIIRQRERHSISQKN